MTKRSDEQVRETASALAKALTGEDDLGVIIRAHIYIEAELEHCLNRLLKDSQHLGNDLEFEMKVRLAFALGLRNDLKSPLNALGKLRNKFAHQVGTTLTKDAADNFYATLAKKERDDVDRSMKLLGRKGSHKALEAKERMILYLLALWGALLLEQHPNPITDLFR
jgi:hypothetical protein